MLRITSIPSADTTTLILEGSLSGPWVQEFSTQVAAAGNTLHLDLAAVTFIDTQGLQLLRALQSCRIPITAASPFAAALLGLEKHITKTRP